MPTTTLAQMLPMLQTAIGPTILISGVGLLLLAMTNRLGRIIDGTRVLADKLEAAAPTEKERLVVQIGILWKRAHLMRLSITLAASSALLAAMLIIAIFSAALFHLESGWVIGVLFVLCMASLVLSLIAFIQDVNRSLSALRLELAGQMPGL